MAVMAMLYDLGVQTVLPPKFLCCGYPQRGAGDLRTADRIVTDNRVLFHRLANTLNYLDIRTVVVSCGTCLKQLKDYHFNEIFPNCRVIDVHDYLLEHGVTVMGAENTRYMYHDPCHPTFNTPKPVESVNKLISAVDASKVLLTDRCCGESGTFAVGRPDIATQVRFRKEESVVKTKHELVQGGFTGRIKVLTTCPGCLQGMSRYNDATGTSAEFLTVELARQRLGENWLEDFKQAVAEGGIERVLV